MQLRHLAFAACWLAGCGQPAAGEDPEPPVPGPDFEVVYRTKYVDIAPGFTQPICRGSLDDIDRHVEATADFLEIDVEDRITLYWYNANARGALAESDEICNWCACKSCYNHGAVHTRFDALHHELVHAVIAPAWGWSDGLFAEGIPGALDRIELWVGLPGHGDAVTIYPALSSIPPSDYIDNHSDGHFVLWLIERFGLAAMREMFEPRLRPSSSVDDVRAAFEDVYGMTFEDVEAEYYSSAPQVYPVRGLCDGLLEVPWSDGMIWDMQVDADCDAPYVFGPNDDGQMVVVAVVDVPPELVGTTLATWNTADTLAHAWPCIEAPIAELADYEHLGTPLIHNYSTTEFRMAGRHRIELPVADEGDVRLRLCRDNGKFPGSYPADKTIDPENCL